MAKWIWPVMIEMPDDYDFDGASDDEKRALQRLDMYVIHDLSNAIRSALRAERTFHPSQIRIGSVMLPGRAYGWDVTGEYQVFAERLRKELSNGEVSILRKDDAGG